MRITAAQCRAARALLGWSQDDLAERASLSVRALINFEQGKTVPQPRTMTRLIARFEEAGIRFTSGDGRRGVSITDEHPAVGRISEA